MDSTFKNVVKALCAKAMYNNESTDRTELELSIKLSDSYRMQHNVLIQSLRETISILLNGFPESKMDLLMTNLHKFPFASRRHKGKYLEAVGMVQCGREWGIVLQSGFSYQETLLLDSLLIVENLTLLECIECAVAGYEINKN